MKRRTVFALLVVVVMYVLCGQNSEDVEETFNWNAKTTEAITEELISALLIQNVDRDIHNFYSQYYSGEIMVYIYEIQIKQIEKEDEKSIIVTMGVTPQVGAHNPLGYDEIKYAVDAGGTVTLKELKHLKTYSLSE